VPVGDAEPRTTKGIVANVRHRFNVNASRPVISGYGGPEPFRMETARHHHPVVIIEQAGAATQACPSFMSHPYFFLSSFFLFFFFSLFFFSSFFLQFFSPLFPFFFFFFCSVFFYGANSLPLSSLGRPNLTRGMWMSSIELSITNQLTGTLVIQQLHAGYVAIGIHGLTNQKPFITSACGSGQNTIPLLHGWRLRLLWTLFTLTGFRTLRQSVGARSQAILITAPVGSRLNVAQRFRTVWRQSVG